MIVLNNRVYIMDQNNRDYDPIRLHGEGGVYHLYCSQPPGGQKEPTASLFRTIQTHPGYIMK